MEVGVDALLWLAGGCAVLAIAVGSVGGVLLRGPSASTVPVWGGVLRALALVLAVAAVGLGGAWLIAR